MQPFLDSTDMGTNGPELRKRMERDGYLFLRGVVPADVLQDLRTQLLRIAREAGWVRGDAPLDDALADLSGFCVEPQPEYMQVCHRMYRLPAFHAMQHHASLVGLLERVLEDPVLPHPRLIARTIFPQREDFTTPAHQDFIPIQGTAETYTAWIPMGDVPSELGGLQIAAGSHRSGLYDFRPALGAGGMEVTDPLEDTWVSSPFALGDVLLFHSMTVHKGLPNLSNRLRMSIDGRYQRRSDPVAPDSLEPHGNLVTWEELYSGWPDTELKYYWRKWDLTIKDYDSRYYERRDRMAFEMAETGDQLARSTLERIVSRDPDPAKRKRAEECLAMLEACS